VAEQGYLAPLEHGAGSCCRSLYALALMFPPKLSSHTGAGGDGLSTGSAPRWLLRRWRLQQQQQRSRRRRTAASAAAAGRGRHVHRRAQGGADGERAQPGGLRGEGRPGGAPQRGGGEGGGRVAGKWGVVTKVEFLPGSFSLLCAQRRHIRICFGLPVHRSLVRPSVVPRCGECE
jgi:hypothetical protein